MRKRIHWVVWLVMGAFMLSGCTAAVVSVAAVGGTGTYFYMNGDLKADYNYPFEATWIASQRSIADMRGVDVEQQKEIGYGSIAALVNDEKVKIEVLYKAKNLTTVSVRVGLMGDKISSQFIHDKIGDNLAGR